jgi:hypothetical protein
MRIAFRVLLAATLAMMFIGRYSGGHLPLRAFAPFYYWFLISVFVFGIFGLIAAFRAWREPLNRRAWLFDVMLAAVWVPYWYANLR